MEVILLDYEDIIRLSVEYLLKKRNVPIKTFENHKDYMEHYGNNSDRNNKIIISSDISESKSYGYVYLKKPYTAEELFNLIKQLGNFKFDNVL